MNTEKCIMPDELELSVDFLRSLNETADLSNDRLREWAEEAIRIGREAALPYRGRTVLSMITEKGIHVEMREGGVFGGRLLRALYDHSVRTITVYEEGVLSAMRSPGPDLLGVEASMDSVRNVLMCHEFFHCLEFMDMGLVGKKFTVPGKVLFFKKNKPVYAVSEISANAFAKTVLDLKCSPFILDYFLQRPSAESTEES